jgi:DNA-directed RNA polymerase specialized sigma24 family protein
VTEAARKKAEQAVKAAQRNFDRKTTKVHAARRKVFEEAREAGLTLREIGQQAGLHHTTVGEIIRGR